MNAMTDTDVGYYRTWLTRLRNAGEDGLQQVKANTMDDDGTIPVPTAAKLAREGLAHKHRKRVHITTHGTLRLRRLLRIEAIQRTPISDGNEVLARPCAVCPHPILPGQLYYGPANGGGSAHFPDCAAEAGESA